MELLKSICNNNNNNNLLSLPDNKWTQSNSYKLNDSKLNDSKLNSNKYNKSKKKYYSLETLLISNFDANCFNESDDFFYNKKKIEYSNNIDDKDYYNKFNYSKKLSIKTIQSGLYEKNQLSNIIFLCDLFKICLYINYNDNLYKISIKNENNPLLVNFNKGWLINDNHEILKKSIKKITELKNIINFNLSIPDNNLSIPCNIYKSSLDPINKYKLEDLINLAKQNNIELIINNKKKTKQILYNELYLILI